MKAQAAVEHIIILGIIILIALIVVGSLGGFGISEFSMQASQRTTEISGLLGDVALKYIIGDNGAVQINIRIRSQTSSRITAHNFSITNSTGGVCWIFMNDDTVGQQYKSYSNVSCADVLGGTAGEAYSFDCTLKYKDSANIEHSKAGKCEGDYEDL